MNEIVHLDFEARSRCDIRQYGAWIYTHEPSTEPLGACWKIGNGEVETWNPELIGSEGGPFPASGLPESLFAAVKRGALIAGWNIFFERLFWKHVMVERYGWPEVLDEQWRDTMAKGQAHGLPGALEAAALALRAIEKKDSVGHALMMKLARPRKPSKNNPAVWWGNPNEFRRLLQYCAQDVRTEACIDDMLLDLSPEELEIWKLDQEINLRGWHVDRELCERAIELDKQAAEKLNGELNRLTDKAVPKKTARLQLKKWLEAQGVELPLAYNASEKKMKPTTAGKVLVQLLEDPDLPEHVAKVICIWDKANKSSTGKYKTILKGSKHDSRLHGIFRYHAAGTGRWAAYMAQLHNLPRPKKGMANMEELAADIKNLDVDEIETLYGRDSVPQVLSSALRGVLTATPGRKLNARDFSAVETRSAAWMAGDEELLNVFRELDATPDADWDQYTWQASQILDRRVTKAEEDQDDRQNWGKVPTLACVYQGSGKALQRYAKDVFGVDIKRKKCNEIVSGWRFARQPIVDYWPQVEEAAMLAVHRKHRPGQERITQAGLLRFKCVGRFLFMRLPSGRRIAYLDPRIMPVTTKYEVEHEIEVSDPDEPEGFRIEIEIEEKEFTKDALTYMGFRPYGGRSWERVSTHGGRIFQNANQGVCRDLLAYGMLQVAKAGGELVGHVHDEGVTDGPMADVMCALPDWAKDFPLASSFWEAFRYKK